MLTHGLGGLTLLTFGLGISWSISLPLPILRPHFPVDVESITITDIDEELEFDD